MPDFCAITRDKRELDLNIDRFLGLWPIELQIKLFPALCARLFPSVNTSYAKVRVYCYTLWYSRKGKLIIKINAE